MTRAVVIQNNEEMQQVDSVGSDLTNTLDSVGKMSRLKISSTCSLVKALVAAVSLDSVALLLSVPASEHTPSIQAHHPTVVSLNNRNHNSSSNDKATAQDGPSYSNSYLY